MTGRATAGSTSVWFVTGSILVGGCLDWQTLYGPSCGNGVVEEGEECDDLNSNDEDACTSNCRLGRCGDGILRTGVEECDGFDADCTSACTTCRAGAAQFFWPDNQRCYTRHDQRLSWPEARASCGELGGDLVTYLTLHEADAVYTTLLTEVRLGSWIGLSDPENQHRFEWVTNEPIRRAWWAEGEPAVSDRDCAYQSPWLTPRSTPSAYALGWIVDDCMAPHTYVCETPGWTVRTTDGHAYRLFTQPVTWEQARDSCAASGAYLVKVENAEEQAFVAALAFHEFWIGANDIETEQEFQWATGGAVEFSLFAPGEPDDPNGSDDCVLIGVDELWHDRACKDRRAYICEHD